jgi:hypothetical protein
MRKGFLVLALGLVLGAPLGADSLAATDAAVAQAPHSMDAMECNLLLACLSVGFLAVLAVTVLSLKKGGWRLDEALSEETAAPLAGSAAPAAAASSVQRLAPSTSRLIAFLGLIASLTLFLGVGFCYIWRLANGVALPSSSDIMPIIYGGAVTFAPYAFNKASEAISNLLPGK